MLNPPKYMEGILYGENNTSDNSSPPFPTSLLSFICIEFYKYCESSPFIVVSYYRDTVYIYTTEIIFLQLLYIF